MRDQKSKTELLLALEQLEREKGINREEVFKTISDALVSSLRKYYGKTAQIMAGIDPETGELAGFLVKKVVEEVFTPEIEISLPDAKKIKADAALNEDLYISVEIKDFARIAAQTAKQVLLQKVRDIEKKRIFEEYKPREGEIITGVVHHISGRDIFVDLGKAEAVLPYNEQIHREHYSVNQRVRAIIQNVVCDNKGLQIVLSRASNAFLKSLFTAEVPEISDKLIEIVGIARDPGFRAKVLVRSNSVKVDPVGACVGMRGSRIRVIMNELSNEKIDLIPYVDDQLSLVAKSLSPAIVSSVKVLNRSAKRIQVIVSDNQLAMAIGREGQNIRLANRLTGWEIEVKSETQRNDELRRQNDIAMKELLKVDGVGAKVAETLITMGIMDIKKLSEMEEEVLMGLDGIGDKTAQKILAGAKKFIEEYPSYGQKEAAADFPKTEEDK